MFSICPTASNSETTFFCLCNCAVLSRLNQTRHKSLRCGLSILSVEHWIRYNLRLLICQHLMVWWYWTFKVCNLSRFARQSLLNRWIKLLTRFYEALSVGIWCHKISGLIWNLTSCRLLNVVYCLFQHILTFWLKIY
jgi:hypothetical protein